MGVEEGHGEDPVGDPQHERAPAGEFVGVCLAEETGDDLAVQAVVLGRRRGVHGFLDAVEEAADDVVPGFEAPEVVGIAGDAELLAHLAGQGEEEQVGHRGQGHRAVVARGGQPHAQEQRPHGECPLAAGGLGDEGFDLGAETGGVQRGQYLVDFGVGDRRAAGTGLGEVILAVEIAGHIQLPQHGGGLIGRQVADAEDVADHLHGPLLGGRFGGG
ncbi:hypothetical protein [Streptomyces jumonjinensis]|uniref:hypothetical protein n=1 Tax=Streptomyces jumonjinensis TaxID=1945 RepID=UPI0037B69FFD